MKRSSQNNLKGMIERLKKITCKLKKSLVNYKKIKVDGFLENKTQGSLIFVWNSSYQSYPYTLDQKTWNNEIKLSITYCRFLVSPSWWCLPLHVRWGSCRREITHSLCDPDPAITCQIDIPLVKLCIMHHLPHFWTHSFWRLFLSITQIIKVSKIESLNRI